ncbi:hypothetical protein C8F01DRAFT_1030595 [Mycena amicta]|nr:hypothetical protein C8F01DRAFT_1030595 [Mycena amicta]
MTHNQKAMTKLFACLRSRPGSCGRNQTSIIILGSHHFIGFNEGHMGGEEIWARSTVAALDVLGYTYLYSPHWDATPDQPATLRGTMELYRMFPDLVKAVVATGDETRLCSKDPRCILSAENPYGIPVWKLFSFSFWAEADNLLGHQWTLNPEDYQREHSWLVPNNYLGYSVEPGCATIPFVPHEQRQQPPMAFVMAKYPDYFKPPAHAWTAEYYREAANATGARFFSGVRSDMYKELPEDFPSDLMENLGWLPLDRFYRMLSGAGVVIGVGMPGTSPTMYDALCLGVPVINPILDWNKDDPMNRDQWNAQHGTLKELDPPYVYNVFKGDKEGFVKAVKDALANPIQSYILDQMRMSAVEERLGRILETDWKGEAEKLLEERKRTGEGALFTI